MIEPPAKLVIQTRRRPALDSNRRSRIQRVFSLYSDERETEEGNLARIRPNERQPASLSSGTRRESFSGFSVSEQVLLELVIKMTASAAIVVAASLLTERAGPLVGATIASLPWASGPAYILLAMDHDAGFLARSALVSLVVFAPNLLFALAYSALAQRHDACLASVWQVPSG